jgi:5,10-methylene-tetrahydrofolate dehydrogenase/methenyl tetrahydrofolate cyclohydrolase
MPFEYYLPETASINEILNTIGSINRDERVNGLLVFLPLPRRINYRRVVNEIIPEKDIDGLGSLSVGRLAVDESTFQIFKRGDYASLITPVPGGVGPVTIAMLLENTVRSAHNNQFLKHPRIMA